jgi:hypothetical protein
MYKEVVRSIFGQSEKDRFKTHMGIYDAYGIGKDGFKVSSCQFAMHYFFKSVETLHGFMRNVCECTAMNGYFIGTCYDGQVLMHELRRYMFDEGLRVYDNQHLMCEIIKKYDSEEFAEDESCLGKQIMVYQDSINQYLPEYLVHFRYLTKIASLYGFELLSKLECKQLNLPMSQSDGMFQTMFVAMRNNSSSEYADAIRMSESEKYISFLNRYFVFKKVLEVNAESVYNSFINPSQAEPALMDQASVEELKEDIGPIDVVPLQNKIVLKSVEDVVEEEEEEEKQEPIVQVPQTKKAEVEPVKQKRVAKKAQAEPGQELVTELPKKKRTTTKKAVTIAVEQVLEPIAQVEEQLMQVQVEEPVKKKRVAKKANDVLPTEEKAPTKTRKTKKDADKEP